MASLITSLCVSGYRSLRDLRLGLGRINIVTGANGSGKSSLYRALRLLAEVAQGRIIKSLAAEGGFKSTLWAGPETISRGVREDGHPVQGTVRRGNVSLKLGFSSDDYGYAIDLGLPLQEPGTPTFFKLDPQIRAESLWSGSLLGRANEFAKRTGTNVMVRGETGAWRSIAQNLAAYDSMVGACGDPRAAPELIDMRERLRSWRFYDHLRTDAEAPARCRQIGTFTPVLAGDGADLGAALQTIIEIGDVDGMAAAINDAFRGSKVGIDVSDGFFEVVVTQPGMLRPLRTSELSDGTLRYLLLVAALLSPRPPELMVLNEPETSLHPHLLTPLARLVVMAARRSQIIVVTHAPVLAEALRAEGDCTSLVLEKQLGETILRDGEPIRWTWPSR